MHFYTYKQHNQTILGIEVDEKIRWSVCRIDVFIAAFEIGKS